jgi:small subunit ribosomal protein S8
MRQVPGLSEEIRHMPDLLPEHGPQGGDPGRDEVELVGTGIVPHKGVVQMTMTDPIADMLTRIRNAITVSYETVDIPASKLKVNIAKVLKDEGMIRNFKVVQGEPVKNLRIVLKYDDKGRGVITGLKRVSKPGCRIYSRSESVPQVLNGYGINIVSTSRGLMTDREARKRNIGGEVLCSVW